MPKIPPVAVLIIHRVADFDVWKKAFDAHQPARKAASCLGHDLHRVADDPNVVVIYCPATDAGKLQAFVESADLPDVMKNAGVVGKPSVHMMRPMSEDLAASPDLPGIVVIHPVKDYSKWRAAYDAFDARRQKLGIAGHAVNQALDDPQQVIVYHQAKSLDTLRSFVSSSELKDVMAGAGVAGPPEIHVIEAVELAEY